MPVDVTFVKKTLEQCMDNRVEILQFFDFLEEVLRSPSQKLSLSNFVLKWKSCLHTSSQKMMIVTYVGTWFPKCLTKVELGKQKSWNDFAREYDSSFTECTVDSQGSPEFQPLNFKELIRQTFWKEIYDKFGNVIVSHVFEKCALLYEVDEGLYLLIGAPTGNIHKRLLKFDRKPPAKRGRGTILQTHLLTEHSNPYQLCRTNVHNDVVVGKENTNEDWKVHEYSQRTRVMNQNVGKISIADDDYKEPAMKRIKLMEGERKDDQVLALRWILPKPDVIHELIKHRESVLKTYYNVQKSVTDNQQETTPNLTYICIQNDAVFKPKDKAIVVKQKCTFRADANAKLPRDWKGLKLPENMISVACKDKGQVLIHVYIISETLARRLNIRVKPKGRQRTKASKLPSDSDKKGLSSSPTLHNVDDKVMSKLDKTKNLTTLSSRKHKNLQNIPTAQQIKAVSCDAKRAELKPVCSNASSSIKAFDLSVTLPISPCLYNKSSWSKWPASHSLSKASIFLTLHDKIACIRMICDDILKTPSGSEAAHHHLTSAVNGNWQATDDSNPLNKIILDIVQSFSKFKDVYKLVKNCLSFWQKKFRIKQEQKLNTANVKSKLQNFPKELSSKFFLNSSEFPLESETMNINLTQSTPSTHFSASNLPAILEQQNIPQIVHANTALEGIIDDLPGNNDVSCQLSNAPRTKYDLLRKCSENTFKKRTFKSLKYSIPHNCVMQTIKQIFHIMKIDQLLGSKRNIRGFFKFIRKAIFLGGSKSSLHLSELMSLLHLSDMPFKYVTESILPIEIFTSKLVTWMFNEFLLVLLKTCFYITECNFTRLELRFYLRETWISAAHRMKSHLVGKGALTVLNYSQRKANANLRYVPKRNNSLRSLVIMKKFSWSKEESRTMNNMLHYMDAKINKSRMYLPTTLQHVWRKFYGEWKSNGSPTLYYLRMDIRDAYPSVSLSKLKEILLIAGGERGHKMTMKQFALFGSNGVRRIRKSVFDLRNRENWHSGIHVRPCITMDLGNDKEINVWKILEQIKDIIGIANVVKVGKKTFEFRYGLPQGWGQSPMLCSIYYGYIDSTLYLPYIETQGRLFLRVVDDYLFVSPNANEVLNLMQLMKIGCEKYGIKLNEEKSVNNIFVRSDVKAASKKCEKVTFCGWNFCFTCGHVSRDFYKYSGQDFCSTVTFNMPAHVNSPEQFLRLRGTVIMPARMKPILLDPSINCYKRILLTIFEAAIILSFRFYAILRVVYPNLNALKEDERVKVATNCIHLCCLRLANYAARNAVYHGPSFSSQDQTLCTDDCCGSQNSSQKVTKTEADVEVVFDGQRQITKNALNLDSLMYTSLYGFRLKLLNHFSVFEKVLPQLNRLISRFRRKLGAKHCDIIIEIVGNKMPQCFSEILI